MVTPRFISIDNTDSAYLLRYMQANPDTTWEEIYEDYSLDDMIDVANGRLRDFDELLDDDFDNDDFDSNTWGPDDYFDN